MKFKKGFSLLELILAVAIFSLGSFAMATMLIDSNISTRMTVERADALFYAKEGMTGVHNIRSEDNWVGLTEGTYYLNDTDETSGAWALSEAAVLIDDKYTRSVTITASSTATNYKYITISVDWALTAGRNANITVDTLLANTDDMIEIEEEEP